MPLELPNLDDRTYDDLVQEALAQIPTYAPQWTNYNPSDPGITLIELFAYLSEISIYRLNRVTDANYEAFLKLINGPAWQRDPNQPLSEAIRATVLQLRQSDRAVTATDFEQLALAVNDLADLQATDRVVRVKCIPRRDLQTTPDGTVDQPAAVSIVIVPDRLATSSATSYPDPSSELLSAVSNYLNPRRLLTTRIHVVKPQYVAFGIEVDIFLHPDAIASKMAPKLQTCLEDYFHPLSGGPEGNGWPFGRDIYVSEIYALLDTQPGVNYVTRTAENAAELVLPAAEAGRLQTSQEQLVAASIRTHELVQPYITTVADSDQNAVRVLANLPEGSV